MMYRRIISDDNSKKQAYEYALTGTIWTGVAFFSSLNLKEIIPFLTFSRSFLNYLVGLNFFLFIFCLLWLFMANRLRDKVAPLEIPRMSFKAKCIAFMISRNFNWKNLRDVLKVGVKTSFGYELPNVFVYVENNLSEGFVAIENFGDVAKLAQNNMIQNLSGLLSEKILSKYAFVSSDISRNGNYYIFHFEDAGISHRLIVKNRNINSYLSGNKHYLKLADDLTWRTDLTGHLSIIGRTRAGKSFFAYNYLIPLMKAQGWTVVYLSTKNDIYVRTLQGEHEPLKIVESLEQWIKVMKEREKIITSKGKSKYTEVKTLNDIAIFIDEIGDLNSCLADDKKLKSRWEKAINELTSRSASSGIHVIAMSQMATKESFLPSRARTNCSDAVIFLGQAADNGEDRRYLMAGFELPHKTYLSGQGLARFVTSGRKWETPHFYETPLIN